MAEERPLAPEPGDAGPPATPRWVKVVGLIAGLLILLFVTLQLTGLGGDHGPGRHFSGADVPSVGSLG